ncbi:MAG: hypothetical protein U5K27_04665 [Desulfotignum sp.]|nr:hypothetical protein [Desulfotignum sp.]
MIEKKQSEFYSARGFGLNEQPAENIKIFFKNHYNKIKVVNWLNATLTLFLFTDNEKERKNTNNTLRALFTRE